MFEIEIKPDYEALLANVRREGTPARVHYMELFWDPEVGERLAERLNITDGLDPDDPDYPRWHWIRMHRALGYDYVPVALDFEGEMPTGLTTQAADTAELARDGGRAWSDEARGPIQTMEDFERFPWPKPGSENTAEIEWYEANTPDDMCLRAGCHNVFEFVTWAMGYESLCYALHDQPELVEALFQKVGEVLCGWCEVLVQFERIKLFLGGDDMGFKTATMVSPELLKGKALTWHRRMAELCHRHGRLYCLHACGNLEAIMEALIEDVELDGRHSFEDAIEPVTVAKRRWGDRLSLLGGIDVDFLTRARPAEVRKRVRDTLDACMVGGGYCLGTGNSVANYIPIENFLAMLDEGRRYAM
jgi:uroporphyrinogen decarboxylase